MLLRVPGEGRDAIAGTDAEPRQRGGEPLHALAERREADPPHAAFLALRYAPNAALADLAKLKTDFTIYDKWGFHDSVNVGTGTVSPAYLSLDQGIIMASIAWV